MGFPILVHTFGLNVKLHTQWKPLRLSAVAGILHFVPLLQWPASSWLATPRRAPTMFKTLQYSTLVAPAQGRVPPGVQRPPDGFAYALMCWHSTGTNMIYAALLWLGWGLGANRALRP